MKAWFNLSLVFIKNECIQLTEDEGLKLQAVKIANKLGLEFEYRYRAYHYVKNTCKLETLEAGLLDYNSLENRQRTKIVS